MNFVLPSTSNCTLCFETNKPYLSDFLTTWNACIATFCRVGTMMKLKLSDLYVDSAHSVGNIKQDVTHEFDDNMISLILRPHVHKERSEKHMCLGYTATKILTCASLDALQ